MIWQGRFAAGVVAITAFSLMFDFMNLALGTVLLVLGVGAASRYTTGFWTFALSGLIGGFVAGLLILGPGFRLSMRAVALMEPGRELEFTVGGTLFIVVGIGGLMGAISAIGGSLLRLALGIRSTVPAGVILGVVLLGSLIIAPGDIRNEFFELGAGPWINLPMFGVFAIAYGIAAIAVADKFGSAILPSRRTEPEKVAA